MYPWAWQETPLRKFKLRVTKLPKYWTEKKRLNKYQRRDLSFEIFHTVNGKNPNKPCWSPSFNKYLFSLCICQVKFVHPSVWVHFSKSIFNSEILVKVNSQNLPIIWLSSLSFLKIWYLNTVWKIIKFQFFEFPFTQYPNKPWWFWIPNRTSYNSM